MEEVTALHVDALLQEVIAQAKAIHIPVSEAIQPHVRINHRATGRFGACFSNKKEGRRINRRPEKKPVYQS